MATEFHLFPFLPWELRDQIWKLAIRPDLPGAHIFRVSDADDHETSDDNDSYRCAKSLLAAPQCLPKSVDFTPAAPAAATISWTLNNPSTYLIDSGLWTACKESRLAIEQVSQARAQREGLWSLKELAKFREKRGRFDLPETTTFATCSRGSKRRPLPVFPSKDLVILQSLDLSDLDWQDLEAVWDSFPTYFLHQGDCVRNDPSGHMAVEYDPAWDRSDMSWIVDWTVSNTAPAGPFTLWFIDHRIKRNPRYQATGLGDESQTVFYASERRYVQVHGRQLAGWAGHKRMWDAGTELQEDVNHFYSHSWSGLDKFVHALASELTDYCIYYHESGREDIWPAFGEIRYGLLACEYL